METRVNPIQVSHIKLYPLVRGVRNYYNDPREYTWLPTRYFMFLWFIKTPFINYEEGFYLNGRTGLFEGPLEFPSKKYFEQDGEVYSYPFIEIYSAGKLIKSEYFKDYQLAKDYCSANFPKVNVIFTDT